MDGLARPAARGAMQRRVGLIADAARAERRRCYEGRHGRRGWELDAGVAWFDGCGEAETGMVLEARVLTGDWRLSTALLSWNLATGERQCRVSNSPFW